MLVYLLWGYGAGATWPAVFLGFVVWSGLAACVPRGHRRTDAGQDAARRWLGVREAVRDRGPTAPGGAGWTPLRDPLPARAVAAGADPALVSTLTTSDADHAWSGFGEGWRRRRAGLSAAGPSTVPPRPAAVALVGGLALLLVLGGTGWFLLPALSRSAGARLFVLALFAALGLAVGVSALLRAGYERALVAPRVFDGQVVRRWMDEAGEGTGWYLAVDDGVSPDALVWSVDHRLHARFPTGSRVRVTTDARGRLISMVGSGS
jgi:hypothetical protein